jgi:hypothetical protein
VFISAIFLAVSNISLETRSLGQRLIAITGFFFESCRLRALRGHWQTRKHRVCSSTKQRSQNLHLENQE